MTDNGDVNFRKLDVYRLAIEHLSLTSVFGPKIPKGNSQIHDQLKRAALSIVLNIAESSGRTTRADQRRFLSIARGSAMECAAIVDVCRAQQIVVSQDLDEADAVLTSIVRILSKLAR